jgi:hypothetical protein
MTHYPQIKALQEWLGDDQAAFVAFGSGTSADPTPTIVSGVTTYVVVEADRNIFVDDSADTVTVTLMPAADVPGRTVSFTALDGSNGVYVFQSDDSSIIAPSTPSDGMFNQGMGFTLVSDGTMWWVIGADV